MTDARQTVEEDYATYRATPFADRTTFLEEADRLDQWRQVASRGSGPACFLVGRCLIEGIRCSKDVEEACRWYLAGANAGDPLSQNNLAACYSTGNGVEMDPEAAVRWWEAAAEGGSSVAQARMGDLHVLGEVMSADLQRAAHWYSRASAVGDERAGMMLNMIRSVQNLEASVGAVPWMRVMASKAFLWIQDRLEDERREREMSLERLAQAAGFEFESLGSLLESEDLDHVNQGLELLQSHDETRPLEEALVAGVGVQYGTVVGGYISYGRGEALPHGQWVGLILLLRTGRLDEARDLTLSEIQALPPEIGRLSKLTSLDLARTDVRSLPREVAELSALERLDLSGDGPCALSDHLGDLPQLRLLVVEERGMKLPPSLEQRRDAGKLTVCSPVRYDRRSFLQGLPDDTSSVDADMAGLNHVETFHLDEPLVRVRWSTGEERWFRGEDATHEGLTASLSGLDGETANAIECMVNMRPAELARSMWPDGVEGTLVLGWGLKTTGHLHLDAHRGNIGDRWADSVFGVRLRGTALVVEPIGSGTPTEDPIHQLRLDPTDDVLSLWVSGGD